MKKFAFLALVFFFFYAAGMYESQALLVVSLTQALLMVLMLMLSIYFKQSLEVTFSEKTVFAVKEEPFIWNIRVRNRGRLPVSKFLLKVWIEQKDSSLREKRKIYGNGDCGEHQLPFQETLFHCGIVIFHGAQLKVYDYLSLFVRKRSLEEEMELIVFPEDLEMLIEIRFHIQGMPRRRSGRSGNTGRVIRPGISIGTRQPGADSFGSRSMRKSRNFVFLFSWIWESGNQIRWKSWMGFIPCYTL